MRQQAKFVCWRSASWTFLSLMGLAFVILAVFGG